MNRTAQAGIVLVVAAAITVGHYFVDPHAAATHEFLQRLYYFPIVLAGLWFGVRGGLLTAFLISIAYTPHAWHGWHGSHGSDSFFYKFLEMVMFHFIGGLTGLLASRTDRALQAEKTARAEREAAYEDLRQKTTELFELEEQLRRSDRLAALGRLSAGLAHEIRNPLSSIKTSAEILRERVRQLDATQTGDGEDAPDFHAVLLEETERLDRIVTNFLEFARQEQTRPGDAPPLARASDAIEKTLGLLAHQLERQGIAVDFRPGDFAVAVAVPEAQLRQVFLNLLLNAAGAMPQGGRITIGAGERTATHLALTIEDTGPGVDAQAADHIFEPFFTTRQGGTGLGLPIVERILNPHGGRIALDRTQMPSSRFRLELPLAAARPEIG